MALAYSSDYKFFQTNHVGIMVFKLPNRLAFRVNGRCLGYNVSLRIFGLEVLRFVRTIIGT